MAVSDISDFFPGIIFLDFIFQSGGGCIQLEGELHFKVLWKGGEEAPHWVWGISFDGGRFSKKIMEWKGLCPPTSSKLETHSETHSQKHIRIFNFTN